MDDNQFKREAKALIRQNINLLLRYFWVGRLLLAFRDTTAPTADEWAAMEARAKALDAERERRERG